MLTMLRFLLEFLMFSKLVELYNAVICNYRAKRTCFVTNFHYLTWLALFVAVQCVTVNTTRYLRVHHCYTSYCSLCILV